MRVFAVKIFPCDMFLDLHWIGMIHTEDGDHASRKPCEMYRIASFPVHTYTDRVERNFPVHTVL